VNETSSILISILLTVALAVYTLLGMMLCVKTNEKYLPKWLPWLKENRFRVLLIFPFGWLAMIVLLFIVPLLVFDYFMNEIDKIGSNGRFLVFLGWIMPILIYSAIHLIRKSKAERK
jgi:hypothetical protein